MSGFSYKNLLLQIIHGSLILGAVIFLLDKSILNSVSSAGDLEEIWLVVFIFLSFIIGVLIDFIADFLEYLLVKSSMVQQPSFYLLQDGKTCGISLAHHRKILEDLCYTAAKNSNCEEKDFEYFKNEHTKKNKEIINYIFQTAKNQDFRECQDYQKEQIESFFMLYIFSRNLSLSFLVVIPLLLAFPTNLPMPGIQWFISLIFAVLFLIALLSSHRYYIYYSRIILGSTFKPNK
jgi:hypothetical protein